MFQPQQTLLLRLDESASTKAWFLLDTSQAPGLCEGFSCEDGNWIVTGLNFAATRAVSSFSVLTATGAEVKMPPTDGYLYANGCNRPLLFEGGLALRELRLLPRNSFSLPLELIPHPQIPGAALQVSPTARWTLCALDSDVFTIFSNDGQRMAKHCASPDEALLAVSDDGSRLLVLDRAQHIYKVLVR
jgi:hypothetical protein